MTTTLFTLSPQDAELMRDLISFASEAEAFNGDDAELETLWHALRPRKGQRIRLRVRSAALLLMREVIGHCGQSETWWPEGPQLAKMADRLDGASQRLQAKAGS